MRESLSLDERVRKHIEETHMLMASIEILPEREWSSLDELVQRWYNSQVLALRRTLQK